MKIARLLGIVTLLLRQDHVTAPELAQRFEVSRRTIGRDIEALCQAGLPIATTQGYGGGISISRAYKIDRSLLTQEESQVLAAAVRALGGVQAVEDARALLDKLPQASAGSPVEVDLAAFHRRALAEKIALLRGAMADERLVSFTYSAPGGESGRKVEPYRLLYRYSAWYLHAYCLERQGFRLFKLDRMAALARLEEGFAPRALDAEPEPFQRYFDAEAHRLQAVFDPAVRYRLLEEYGPEGFTERADGLYMDLPFSSYEWMRDWVLGFGDKVRVLAPAALIGDLAAQARRVLAMYS